MVYLLDPNSNTAMSQDHMFLARAISERYPEFSLAQVPMSDRSKNEEFPFAILLASTKEVVKPLRENEMNINIIFKWLYENDSQVHGSENLYKKFKAIQQAEKDKHENEARERLAEKLEVIHSMANSPIIHYKLGKALI